MDECLENETFHSGEEGGTCSFSWRRISHEFAIPLTTAHGRWTSRSSIIVRLRDESGTCGYGEISPLESFGSPDIAACEDFCRALGARPDLATLADRELPGCLRFAFGSAMAMMQGRLPRCGNWAISQLLPPGPRSLYEAGRFLRKGCRCMKYKFRGYPDATEREIVEMLFETLYTVGGRLRIDANESLTGAETLQCLEWIDAAARGVVDFVEQPLPRGSEAQMLELMQKTGIPIALDESVSGQDAFEDWKSWPGPVVIKTSLCGDPIALAGEVDAREGRTIFSSAFESPVGLWGCLLAIGQRDPDPLGMGVGVWAENDPWGVFTNGCFLDSSSISIEDMEAVWNGAGI